MKSLTVVLALLSLALLTGCASSLKRLAVGDLEGCDGPVRFQSAAIANTASLNASTWAPFGRQEQGWAVYALRVRREIASGCAPTTAGFSEKLAAWQAMQALTPSGAMDITTLQRMKTRWQAARPFVALRAKGLCPVPPPDAALVQAAADETYDGKMVQLRAGALRALHRMLSAAKVDVPGAAQGPYRLAAFSGYRSPTYDAARCQRDGDCDGVGRAICSAHRTGLAVDIVLEPAAGYAVDSTQDTNRRHQTQTAAYRWLFDNAARFGFVNYAFEPWHWEWTGEAP